MDTVRVQFGSKNVQKDTYRMNIHEKSRSHM